MYEPADYRITSLTCLEELDVSGNCCINGSYYILNRFVLGRRLLQKLETELYVNLMGRPKSHSANIRGKEIHFILVLCLHKSVLQEQKFECTDQLVP